MISSIRRWRERREAAHRSAAIDHLRAQYAGMGHPIAWIKDDDAFEKAVNEDWSRLMGIPNPAPNLDESLSTRRHLSAVR